MAPLFGGRRYGPNTQAVEHFIARLGALSEDDWQTTLAHWVYRPSGDARQDPIRTFMTGTNMPRAWEEAYNHADRVADPDRTQAWLTAGNDAVEPIKKTAIAGMIKFTMSRPAEEYRAWVATLPGGRDPNGPTSGKGMRDMADAYVASTACAMMTIKAVAALVVRDRIPPYEFDLLYEPFSELIPVASL
jgi:hypothetical protein